MSAQIQVYDLDGIGFNSAMQDIYNQVTRKEEEVVINVLTEWLGRKPEEDDFRNCQRVMRQGQYDRYILCYDNIPLGSIAREIGMASCKIIFNPHQLTF